MNEYARLAKAKDPTARTTAELVAAAYGLDENQSNLLAIRLDETPIEKLQDALPQKTCNVKELARLIQEITKRRNPEGLIKEGLPVMNNVNAVAAQVVEIRDKKKEYLLAFFLNARHQLIEKEIISIGTLTASLAHPREIFAPAIGKAAAGVILAHNHPSGDPSPSDEDMRLTRRISQAGHILGIDLLDHLIVGEQGCYSFKTAGAL